MDNEKIAVVLVTFNRLDKLKIALDCYEKQTYPLQQIIVVDNCSSDGTDKFLKEWKELNGKCDRKVISLSENSGGAGGFGSGMDYCLDEISRKEIEVDWVMVSDDDAFPKNDAIEQLVKFYSKLSESDKKNISAISSEVLNNGKIHTAHRSRIKCNYLRVRFIGVDENEYKKEAFEIDLFSYVGTMIKVSALEKGGTTNKKLFIYGDDNEHSLRLKKHGKLMCVPASIFNHNTPGVESRSVGWHNYYNRRNQFYILKTYFPKRYLIVRLIKRYICDISIFSKYNKQERKLFKTAQQDALRGKLGKHSLYKPGFKIQGDN